MLREAQLVGIGLIALVLYACSLLSTCSANRNQRCRPSSCGDISNISHPFRLKGDPSGCGDPEYELICENNRTTVNLGYHRNNFKYHVTQINYQNYTIGIVDPDIKKENCFSPWKNYYYLWYSPYDLPADWGYNTVVMMNCDWPISDHNYIPVIPCNSSLSMAYAYAVVGDSLQVRDIPFSCTISGSIVTRPLKVVSESSNLSMSDLQEDMLLGIQLSFFHYHCLRECDRKGFSCYKVDFVAYTFQCRYRTRCSSHNMWCLKNAWRVLRDPDTLTLQGFKIKYLDGCEPLPYCKHGLRGAWALRTIVFGRTTLGLLCMFAYLIYKFRLRHSSLDDGIEEFLQGHKHLQPIKYSYSEVKKMTNNFKNKLGQGGFGSVYKGKLRSGRDVAIKVLTLSKTNGQDLINEVATIGRIRHINVVRLVGFCVQGSKWALIYDFMPNGSLDKFVFLKRENNSPLSWEMLYRIAIGVGRGIEYLHQGCEMQILHFDIKPHNILLDENFTPKVSDFGLAKLCSTDESIVSLTAARGTLGYIAPELFYKNIGGVSHKADVYSFGMLLMKMVGKRKHENECVKESQIYFPSWIYDRIDQGEDLEIGDATKDEKNYITKIVIVALWCVQVKPTDRPSMSKALEMLEGEVELLQLPSRPTLYSREMSVGDHMNNPVGIPISSRNATMTISLDGR